MTTRWAGLNGRVIACARGKVLGGSSAINAMICMRGDPADFDHWRELGNPGWGWDEVLPIFRRLEDSSLGTSAWHGAGGPLPVSHQVSPHPLSQAFVDAAADCGHASNNDFNGACVSGAGLYHLTTRKGKRCSTADAFLQPARQRPNLRVLTQARALRVLLERGRAQGVELVCDSRIRRIQAREELILCAGAIDSPKLLLLSGVGDPGQLEPLGLAVMHALPGVGQGLTDHPQFGLLFEPREMPSPTTGTPYAEAGLFMRSATPEPGWSFDIQFHFAPWAPSLASARGSPRGTGMGVVCARPHSRGSVRLRSKDPFDTPLIDPAYLQDPADVSTLVDGIRAARRIGAVMVAKGTLTTELFPGRAFSDNASALSAAMRAACDCVWHPASTCRMGQDELSVVDAELRVHGIDRLRVVDASVMPRITSANLNAPTIMIAEKAAALIRKACTSELQ